MPDECALNSEEISREQAYTTFRNVCIRVYGSDTGPPGARPLEDYQRLVGKFLRGRTIREMAETLVLLEIQTRHRPDDEMERNFVGIFAEELIKIKPAFEVALAEERQRKAEERRRLDEYRDAHKPRRRRKSQSYGSEISKDSCEDRGL